MPEEHLIPQRRWRSTQRGTDNPLRVEHRHSSRIFPLLLERAEESASAGPFMTKSPTVGRVYQIGAARRDEGDLLSREQFERMRLQRRLQ